MIEFRWREYSDGSGAVFVARVFDRRYGVILGPVSRVEAGHADHGAVDRIDWPARWSFEQYTNSEFGDAADIKWLSRATVVTRKYSRTAKWSGRRRKANGQRTLRRRRERTISWLSLRRQKRLYRSVRTSLSLKNFPKNRIRIELVAWAARGIW